MGLFTSLFGKGGSDKADRMRQNAIDAFNSVKTPELEALQVQLNDYVQQGQITPEQAEATLLNSNAFNDIKTDPSLVASQKAALESLQQIGTQGGLTAVDRARIQDITDTQNQEAKSRLGSILSNAKERGVGGSGLELASALQNEQSAADRAARSGTDVAALAEQRALDALQAAGTTATSMRGQEFNEGATKANAQNAIDQFNATNLNNFNLYNNQLNNSAQAQNLAEKQRIADSNTNTQNQNKIYNASQNQTVFQDQLAKAQGISGVYNNWANDAAKNDAANRAGDVALTGGLVKAGASAFNPMAGAAMNTSESIGGGNTTNPNYKRNPDGSYSFAEGGQVPDVSITPEDEQDFDSFMKTLKSPKMCGGGMVKGYEQGGEVSPTPTPEPKKEEPKKKEDKGLLERIGELLGSHGEEANKVDPEKSPYDFTSGGPVPGKPVVSGDSPKNDTVPAMLSPKEVVVPVSVVEKMKASNDDHYIADALRSLMNPNRNEEI